MSHPLQFATSARSFMNRTEPHNVAVHILTFLDEENCRTVAEVSRAWNKHAYQRGIPRLTSEENILGEYRIIHDLHRSEADAIFRHTGLRISFSSEESVRENYVLGSGYFGTVHIGHSWKRAGSKDGGYVAIKKTSGSALIRGEALIQQRLGGQRHIMQALGRFIGIEPDGQTITLYQMMELAGLGATNKLISSISTFDPVFKEMVLFRIAEGLLQGLDEMHKRGICHLDIKPPNLGLNKDGEVRIFDFGGAAEIHKSFSLRSKESYGDMWYFSPERWLANFFPHESQNVAKVDIWAAGLTLLVLANPKYTGTLEEIFIYMSDAIDYHIGQHKNSPREGLEEALESYVREELRKVDSLDGSKSDTLEALILSLLTVDPTKRPTAAQALELPWCKKMRSASPAEQEKITGRLRELIQSIQTGNLASHFQGLTPTTSLSPRDLPPAQLTDFVERSDCLKSLEQLLFIDPRKYNGTTPPLVCQGMGGVGKSKLLASLIHHPKTQSHFGSRFWFHNCDDENLLRDQFISLAKELHLADATTSFEDALKLVHGYLAGSLKRDGKPWIAVFDNAESESQLAPYLPPAGGRILVTTRSTNWEKFVTIDVLTPEQSEALVKGLLAEDNPHIPELCRELGFHPLALVQACAYLRMDKKVTIPQYIEDLRNDAKIIQADERLFGVKLPSSVHALWQRSFRAISDSYSEAFALLETAAYLSPDILTQDLLLALAPAEAQAVLKRCGLFTQGKRGELCIHRLVQLSLRFHCANTQAAALERGMQAFLKKFDERNDTARAEQTNIRLLPHGETLLSHFDKLSDPSSELLGLWVDLALKIDGQKKDKAPPHKRKEFLELVHLAAKKTFGENHPIFAKSILHLGHVLSDLGFRALAQEHYERTLKIQIDAFGKDNPAICLTLNYLGKISTDNNIAVKYYNEALEIQRKALGNKHPDLAISLNNLGTIHYSYGSLALSKSCFEEAVAINTHVFGSNHSSLATPLFYLGRLNKSSGNLDQAFACCEQALSIQRRTLQADDPQLIMTLNLLGDTCVAQSKFKKALECYQEALNTRKAVYGNKHPDVATSLLNIGKMYIASGEPKLACKYIEQALAILKELFGDEHPLVASALYHLGRAHQFLKNFGQALKYYDLAIIATKKNSGDYPLYLSSKALCMSDRIERRKLFGEAASISLRLLGGAHPLYQSISKSYFEEVDQLIKIFEERKKNFCSIM